MQSQSLKAGLSAFAKHYVLDIAAILLFLLISFFYFYEPVTQGMVLGGHDSDAAAYQGREQQDYRAAHDGETSRWTNAMFSGMPTYQIAPSYGATSFLAHLSDIYNVGTSGVLCYVFVFLLGFYVMLRAFNFRPVLAALGAIVWAFSSYFFIIIAAGHIWKVMTLAYIPPTIGGLVLCYRGRLLWGGAVTALFTAFQVLSNHVQMTYYFLFVMFFIVAAYGVQAFRHADRTQASGNRLAEAMGYALTPGKWLRATGVVIVAGLLGIAANLPNLYHTYEYAQHTMRGGSELSPLPDAGTQKNKTEKAQASKGGLDYDYITQWSYGISETLTLLVPNVKGGGSGTVITDDNYFDEPQQQLIQYVQPVQEDLSQYARQHGEEMKTLPGLNQYWGDQPFTVGPVYVGAFVVFLFILGLFIVRGPLKWALAAATIVSLLFAWGHNAPGMAHLLIDHFPMYNKFRTVSSALVIAEFTMPLLAMLALAEVLRKRRFGDGRRGLMGVICATALTIGVCLVLIVSPGSTGLLSGDEAATMNFLTRQGTFDAQFIQSYTETIATMRAGVVRDSALRSLLILVLGGGTLWAAVKVKRLSAYAVCGVLAVIAIADMWTVNKRYLNTEKNFTDPIVRQDTFAEKTGADEAILKDRDLDYRVLSYTVGNPFNENSTSYWHKNVGGYHAAKLQRYQDLIDRHLMAEYAAVGAAIQTTQGNLSQLNMDSVSPVLNMLNTKYYIVSAEQAVRNPSANGNGWFVRSLNFVKGADAEMSGLSGLDTKHAAVADERFRTVLDGTPLGDGTVKLTAYEPNELHYDVSSPKGGVVVFSEIYYPGWTVTVDGQTAELGRVDYVLRALRLSAGDHKVVMEFRPASVTATNTVAYVAIGVILLLFVSALVLGGIKLKRTPAATDKK